MGNIEFQNKMDDKSYKVIGPPRLRGHISREQFKYLKKRIEGLKKGIIEHQKIINKLEKIPVRSQGQQIQLERSRVSIQNYRRILDDFVYYCVKCHSNSKIAQKIANRQGYPTVYDFLTTRSFEDTDRALDLKIMENPKMIIDPRERYLGEPNISQRKAFLSDVPDRFIDSASRHK